LRATVSDGTSCRLDKFAFDAIIEMFPLLPGLQIALLVR